MSCHEIGPAIGHAISAVLEEYDNGTMDLEVARRLGVKMIPMVNYCDGNTYEIYEVVDEIRCGYCLTKDVGELDIDIISPYNISKDDMLKYPALKKVLGLEPIPSVTPRICRKCFNSIFRGEGFSDKEINDLTEYIQGEMGF